MRPCPLLISLLLPLTLSAQQISLPTSPSLAPKKPVADKVFWSLVAVNAGLAIADVELTQRCLSNGSCREGNPFMPTDRAKSYAMKAAFVGGYSALGYWFKKRALRGEDDHLPWWFPQVALATGQGAVVVIGIQVNW